MNWNKVQGVPRKSIEKLFATKANGNHPLQIVKWTIKVTKVPLNALEENLNKGWITSEEYNTITYGVENHTIWLKISWKFESDLILSQTLFKTYFGQIYNVFFVPKFNVFEKHLKTYYLKKIEKKYHV